MARVIVCNDLRTYGHFAISTWDGYLLAVGFFDRSKTKQRGVAASLGKYSLRWGYRKFATSRDKSNDWYSILTPCQLGRDHFTYCVAINNDVGKSFLLTTHEDLHEDLYHYLMEHYKLPLLKDWMPALHRFFLKENVISQERLEILKGNDSKEEIKITLHESDFSIDHLVCLNFETLTEEKFEEYISLALQKKVIQITDEWMEPLEFETFDDYITKYGMSLVENLNKQISPLTELKPNVDTLALKTKSLFPQQAASVNGALAMMDHGIKFSVLNMGMGVGKVRQVGVGLQ